MIKVKFFVLFINDVILAKNMFQKHIRIGLTYGYFFFSAHVKYIVFSGVSN